MARIPRLDGENLSDLVTCSICLDIFEDPRVFGQCQHTFCCKCIQNHIQTAIDTGKDRLSCPNCRSESIKPVYRFRYMAKNKWEMYLPKNLLASEMISKFKNKFEYCQVHKELYNYICPNHLKFSCIKCLRDERNRCTKAHCFEKMEELAHCIPKVKAYLKLEISKLQIETQEGISELKKAFDKRNLTLQRLKECKKMMDGIIDTLQTNQEINKTEQRIYDNEFQKKLESLENVLKYAKTTVEVMRCKFDIVQLKSNFTKAYRDITSTTDVKTTLINLEKIVKQELKSISKEERTNRNDHSPRKTNATTNIHSKVQTVEPILKRTQSSLALKGHTTQPQKSACQQPGLKRKTNRTRQARNKVTPSRPDFILV